MTPRPDTEHVCESCGYPTPQPVCVQCALYAVAAAQVDALARTVERVDLDVGMTPEQWRERVAGRMRRFGVMA